MTTYTEFNSDMFLCNSLDSLNAYTSNNDIKYLPKSLKDATFYYIGDLDMNQINKFTKSSSNPSYTPPFEMNNDLFNKLQKRKYNYNGFMNENKNLKPINKWRYTFGHLTTMNINTSLNNNKEEINYTYLNH